MKIIPDLSITYGFGHFSVKTIKPINGLELHARGLTEEKASYILVVLGMADEAIKGALMLVKHVGHLETCLTEKKQ